MHPPKHQDSRQRIAQFGCPKAAQTRYGQESRTHEGLYEVARSLTFVNKFVLPTQLMIELQTVDSTGLTEIEPARPTGKRARRATAVRRQAIHLGQRCADDVVDDTAQTPEFVDVV